MNFHVNGVAIPLVSFQPLVVIALIVAATLYIRAVRIVRSRRREVPWTRQAMFWTGLGCVALGLLGPVDALGENYLLSAHMGQHLLIADIAGPLLLLGLRAPLLFFFWPKPILVTVARMKWLRAIWGAITRPLPALVIWLALLTVWHLPVMFDSAVHNGPIHILQHGSFVFGGLLVWWPLLTPAHPHLQRAFWKIAYLGFARVLGGAVGVVLAAASSPIYHHYAETPLLLGVNPLTDQQTAAAMMMLVDMTISVIGFIAFFPAPAPAEAGSRTRATNM